MSTAPEPDFPLPNVLRMIATDLDGTIVAFGGDISDRTLDVLATAESAGIHVVYVTGRPPRWLAPVIERTGHAGYAICANGAVTLDLSDDSVVSNHCLAPGTIQALIQQLRVAVPDILFAVETLSGLSEEEGFRAVRPNKRTEGLAPRNRKPHRVARCLDDLLFNEPVFKVIAVSPASTPDSLLAIARSELGESVSTTHSSAVEALVEFGPRGVTKASALAELADRLRISPENVVAFGDMPNDSEMLRWAGFGYAMADAHSEAIAAADYIAPPAVEDGVARVLEHYLASKPLRRASG